MNSSLQDYIDKAKAQGLTNVEIQQNLINAGWERSVIEKALTPKLTVPTPQANMSKNNKLILLCIACIILIITALYLKNRIEKGIHSLTDDINDDSIIIENPTPTSSVIGDNPINIDGWTRLSENPNYATFASKIGIDFQYPSNWNVSVDGLSAEAFAIFLNTDEGNIEAYKNNAVIFFPSIPGYRDITSIDPDAEKLDSISINNITYNRFRSCEKLLEVCSIYYATEVNEFGKQFAVREKPNYPEYDSIIDTVIQTVSYSSPETSDR